VGVTLPVDSEEPAQEHGAQARKGRLPIRVRLSSGLSIGASFLRGESETGHPRGPIRLVGDGEDRELLENRSARLGLAEAVSFHGWRRDLRSVYGDLDVVVNTSRNEDTPRVGGTPDLLQYDAFGRLVPEGNTDAVAEGILETLRDPTAARYRARAGQAHVPREHSAARLLSDVDRLYRELLAGKSAA